MMGDAAASLAPVVVDRAFCWSLSLVSPPDSHMPHVDVVTVVVALRIFVELLMVRLHFGESKYGLKNKTEMQKEKDMKVSVHAEKTREKEYGARVVWQDSWVALARRWHSFDVLRLPRGKIDQIDSARINSASYSWGTATLKNTQVLVLLGWRWSQRDDRPRTILVHLQQQDVVTLPLKDKLLVLSRRSTAQHARIRKVISNKETYRVSSSRSSATSSVLTNSSPSSSELMASARRAFNGIKSVDWNRL